MCALSLILKAKAGPAGQASSPQSPRVMPQAPACVIIAVMRRFTGVFTKPIMARSRPLHISQHPIPAACTGPWQRLAMRLHLQQPDHKLALRTKPGSAKSFAVRNDDIRAKRGVRRPAVPLRYRLCQVLPQPVSSTPLRCPDRAWNGLQHYRHATAQSFSPEPDQAQLHADRTR